MSSYGEGLRLIRVYHDKTRKEVAEGVGISENFLSELENNKKNLTLEKLESFATYYNTTPSGILNFLCQVNIKEELIKKQLQLDIKNYIKHEGWSSE